MQLAPIKPSPEAALAGRPQPPATRVKASVEVRYIVFFLNDALDKERLARMERAPGEVSFAETLTALCRFEGCGALAYPRNANAVYTALNASDGRDYRLICARVLPNHVHVLLEAAPSWPAGDPIHRWKTESSPRQKLSQRPGLERFGPDRLRPRAMRLEQPRPDEFWADEDFELVLRTPQQVEEARRRIMAIPEPLRRPVAPAPDGDPDETLPDNPRPSLPARVEDLRPSRHASHSPRRKRDLHWWIDEIKQCAKDLSVLYGAYFLMVWLVWVLQRALSR